MNINSYYGNYYNSLSGLGNLFGNQSNSNSVFSQLGKNQLGSSLFSSSGNSSASSMINNSAIQYVKNIKSGAASLKSSISALSSGAAFRQKTAVSSDTDLLTVKTSGSAYYGSKIPDTTVNIQQVASGQVNEGTALKASARVSGSGSQQFAIETGGKTHQFSVEVSANDTNQTLQKKMADAINSRGIGVTASVDTDSKNGTSALTIQARNTGDDDKNRFAIRDVTGSAVAQTGAANRIQDARNAVYSVNGGANKTSATNTVNLGNGVTATLKKASDQAVKISMGVSTSNSMDRVSTFVDSYNRLYTETLNNSSDSKSNRLFSQMVGISRTYKASLDRIGINFDDDGFMTINEDKMKTASENGSLDRFFTSSGNYGFSSQISRLADNVTYNTANYVSKSSFLNENYAFMNSSALSSFYTGMLFDFKF